MLTLHPTSWELSHSATATQQDLFLREYYDVKQLCNKHTAIDSHTVSLGTALSIFTIKPLVPHLQSCFEEASSVSNLQMSFSVFTQQGKWCSIGCHGE